MDNADLLEKLDMIKEDVEWSYGDKGYITNSDRFIGIFVGLNPEVRSLVFFKDGEYKGFHPYQVSKPQRVKVEGWVDAEIVARLRDRVQVGNRFDQDVEALLQLVKEKENE